MKLILNPEENQTLLNVGITRQNWYAIYRAKHKIPVALFTNKKSAEYWQSVYLKDGRIKQIRVTVDRV